MRLFDLHCDTLCEGLHRGVSIRENSGAIDLRRGRDYSEWIQAFAAWIPDDLSVSAAQRECHALLDVACRWAIEEPDFSLILSRKDLEASQTACRALLAVENGGALGPDVASLSDLYDRGVRLVTLTWNGDNYWGSGCFGSPDGGLTAAGHAAVTALEALGMVVDVSHLNEIGFWQVAQRARRPFIATHAASAALCPHPRNLTDEQFRAIRDGGGLVGISLYPEHVGGSDFETIRRHLEHFLSLDGEHIVCFGADFDGMTAPPEWNGITVMERIAQYLATCGWSAQLLDAVFYTNALTFFRQALDAKS